MTKRQKIGNIYCVHIGETKRFFQFIAIDKTQLNSDVIRCFRKPWKHSENPTIDGILNSEVEFYAHCFIKLGCRLGLYEYFGHSENLGTVELYFRDTDDYGTKQGDVPVPISHKWKIWKINDENFTQIGRLSPQFTEYEIGIVFSPLNIVKRMETGKNPLTYPD